MVDQDGVMDVVHPPSVRRHRPVVWLPLVAGAVAVMGTVPAWLADLRSPDVWLGLGGMVMFTTVGALIEDRRPGQAVGRICLLIGGLLMVASLLQTAAVALDSLPGRLPPLGAAFAVISSALSGLAIFAGGPVLINRFPDGREPGRLGIVVDVLLVVSAAILLTGILRPGPLEYDSIEHVQNPLGLVSIPFLNSDDGFAVVFLAYGSALILACVRLVRRYVRGNPVVRAQVRWFGAAIAITFVSFALLPLTNADQELNNAVWGAWILSSLLPPLAIGVAILRYRLYDIDRVISRTISYALVTALLVSVFLLVNLGMQSVLSSVARTNSLAVAGSTLLVAALFTPVRRRVQRLVDRRFNRARYDGERTAGAFSVRMRDATDLPTVAHDLDVTVRRAIAPSSVGLWLRGSGR